MEPMQGKALVMFERYMSLRNKGGNHCHINIVSIPGKAAADLESHIMQFGREENVMFDKVNRCRFFSLPSL